MWAQKAGITLAFTCFILTGSFASHCADIEKRYSPQRRDCHRDLFLIWDSKPSQAITALFTMVLRYAIGIDNINMVPSSLNAIAKEKLPEEDSSYMLGLSLGWEPTKPLAEWKVNEYRAAGLAGWRLSEMGASGVPASVRLHAYIPEQYRQLTECADATQFDFFTHPSDIETLTKCGFEIQLEVSNSSDSSSSKNYSVTVFELDSLQSKTKYALTIFTNPTPLQLKFKDLDRAAMFTRNNSYLFLDYDMWSEHKTVSEVHLPPCTLGVDFQCLQKQDTTIGMRVADSAPLINYEPQIFQLAHSFRPPMESIRYILELMSDGETAKSAACDWAFKNKDIVDEWVKFYNYDYFEVPVFYCDDDPDAEEYDKLIDILNKEIDGMIVNARANFDIKSRAHRMNCSDKNALRDTMSMYTPADLREQILGAVVGGVEGITEAIEAVNRVNIPMIMYNGVAVDVDSTAFSWLSTGNSFQLALALQNFIKSMNWTRVAVLSEDSLTAKQFVNNLQNLDGFSFGDYALPKKLTLDNAKNILHVLKEEARVVYINANYRDAATILSAAVSMGMNDEEKFAWIVRDWQPNKITKDLKHFTLSYWCRNISDVSDTTGVAVIRNKMKELWPTRLLPPQATALADAVFMLVHIFIPAYARHPEFRNDIHAEGLKNLIEQSIIEEPVEGIIQKLIYNGRSLEEAVVFVEEWRGEDRELLARWHVSATTRTVRIERELRAAYTGIPPHDGTSTCFVPSGGPYLPTCHDGMIRAVIVLFVSAIITSIICGLRNRRRQSQTNRARNQQLSLCQLNIANMKSTLAAHKINPSALELRHKIGTGRYGDVRLAMFFSRRRGPKIVAAKELRENVEEKLSETCVLASLDHDRIIRLVGVCLDREPPLVVTEMAFFGDLLKYLQTRRYLAESVASKIVAGTVVVCEETAHVSAEALTRLAHQAASALAYLSLRGVIHCKLCASSCLVDASRSLKLADFSMARTTATSDVEVSKKKENVTWISPKTEDEPYSFASDIWSFGVLVLQMVTLGKLPAEEKPYLIDPQMITESGSPRLPIDASTETKELVQMCWRLDPEERASAEQLVAFLTQQPSALRPALHPQLTK
ncbi:uncharacterized protein LOC142978988 [Anticarsia gemmatalis]|uniref:uncharacterized protein LOC142978988 n=1 Tax=Anticarsia gemmatalis TaxID=129554 RepID=UPI003F765E4E